MSGLPVPAADGSLVWPEPLTEGVLVRRYKRFLADVTLQDGSLVTAHTANTGAMLGCSEPGRPVWLSRHDRPGRKYPYSLEMIRMPSAMVGVNTGIPNRLVEAAVAAGAVAELPRPDALRREVRRGASRLDLLLETAGRETLVEIKNCTLVENGAALFPDAVTVRGARHLEELATLAANGCRAVIFIVVQRSDAEWFNPADAIDPHWGRTLRRVVAAGVELLAYRAEVTPGRIALADRLEARL
ncbi:MAG: DNA/RNA nuclease SfsA [Planctomycetaceae bacterium]|nr:DNA/RNA nuclease SfsA [Planctomycetaceae bacterium]